MCFSAIHWARLDRVVFGTRIEDVQRLGFRELRIGSEGMKALGESPVLIHADFLRDECLELLDRVGPGPRPPRVLTGSWGVAQGRIGASVIGASVHRP